MSKSGYMEVNPAKPLKYEFSMKVNDLDSVLKQQQNITSKYVEIFPGIKVQFSLYRQAPNNGLFAGFGSINWAGKDEVYKLAKFAGKVDVNIDGVSRTETFGSVEKNEFIGFTIRTEVYLLPVGFFPCTANGDKKITVEVKWAIYLQQPVSVFQQEAEIPKSLLSLESRSVVGAAMMEDVATADVTIHCGNEIFRVHKVVLCSRSPVFRAMLMGDMLEAREGKVNVKDVDSGTFATMLHYVYTGELKEGQDLIDLIYAADKYDLPGLKELLFLKMKPEDVQEEFIPELLIIADKHQAGQVKELVMEKIRANRKILGDENFKRKLANAPHILFDLLQQL